MDCLVQGNCARDRDDVGASGMWWGRPDGNAHVAARANEHPDCSAYADSDVGPRCSYADPRSGNSYAGCDPDTLV